MANNASSRAKLDAFTALVNGDFDAVKNLPKDVVMNEYFIIDTPSEYRCFCNIEFEFFLGTAVEMISTYGSAVACGQCRHLDQSGDDSQDAETTLDYLDYHEVFSFVMDENDGTEGGLNAFQVAVMFGHANIVEWLISENEEILHSVTKHLKETTLSLAVARGNLTMVKLLLDRGVGITQYSTITNTSPVTYAAYFNHVEILQYLIDHQGDLSHGGNMFSSPVTCAFLQNNIKCVELLLKTGAEADRKKLLRIALGQGVHDMAQMLVNFVDVNCDLNDGRRHLETPLFLAARSGDLKMVKYLVEKGANVNFEIEHGQTVLFFAVLQNLIELTELLLQLGGSANQVDGSNYSALHFAAWEGNLEICKLLLDHGAQPDTQTMDKNTPFALACHGNHLEVIELLLPLKCHVNNQDKDLDTPLLYTTFNGNFKASLLLLENGADPELLNNFGTSPVWNAVFSGCEELIHHFIQLNVNLEVPSVGIDQHAQQENVVPVYSSPRSLLFVAWDKLLPNIPTKLVLAGFDLSKESFNFSEDLHEEFEEGESSDKIKEVCDEIQGLLHNTRSLKQACRISIRRLMKRTLCQHVSHLGLPCMLQDYLCCREF